MPKVRKEIPELEKLVQVEEEICRYEEGAQLYSMGLHTFQELAKDAKAVYHVKRVVLVPTMKSPDADKKANKTSEAAPAAAAKVAEKVDFSNVKIEPIFQEMVDFDTFAKSDFRAVKTLECEAVPKSKKLLKFVLDDGERKDRVILSGFTTITSRRNWLVRQQSLS